MLVWRVGPEARRQEDRCQRVVLASLSSAPIATLGCGGGEESERAQRAAQEGNRK